MKRLVLLLICIVLLSLEAAGLSLESNGEVHTITQNNLKFETDASGLVKLYRANNYLATFGFTLKGTVNSQEKFLNSWTTFWTWQVLSNTDSNVTILGSTSWQGLEWKQRWFFSETEQKFSNRLTNNTGFDITDTAFYYIVSLDPSNASCLNYVDDASQLKNFCFEEDKTITQNVAQYLRRIEFVNTTFNFQDLVDSGFEFNYLFVGELNSVNQSLSGQGFIVGVTKNSGLFPNGATVLLDPSVVDSSPLSKTNYGNVIARDSSSNIFVVHKETVSSSNSDIFVSKSTDEGVTWTTFNITNTTDFNETNPHIDINSTNGLVVAYDKSFVGFDTTQVWITTCSAGGCDSSGEFLTDFNVSQCSASGQCANSHVVFDVNDNAHLTYSKGGSTVEYRKNTGYVGLVGNWGAEEETMNTGAGSFDTLDGTLVLVEKNGDDRKLVIANTDNGQVRIAYFNTFQWTNFQIEVDFVEEPAAGFAGYDGNFYLTYTRDISGSSSVSRVHYRQCDITSDCNVLANWSSDLNVSTTENLMFVSITQTSDLNVHILASATVATVGSDISIFTRTPNNAFVTSHLADGNTLFSDSNRTFNPLVRNRDYDGQVLPTPSIPTIGNTVLDHVFLTSNFSTGDPSTLLFDSNTYFIANGIIASFTVTPGSPLTLNPEEGITNVNTDFNSTSEEVGLTDVNYSWSVDGTVASTDQNFNRDFNGADADFNITLIVNGQDGVTHFTSQSDQNVLLRTAPQGIDINVTFNIFSNNADVNYGVTSTGTIDSVSWGGTDLDFNRTGLQFRFDYNAEGLKQICAVVTFADANSVHCEVFRVTRALVRRPLDEQTPATVLTPFVVTVDGTAQQNYTGQSADLNVFMFDQNLGQHININVDFNASYFPRNYGIFTSNAQLFFDIQPYLALVANSIQVNWITQDVLSNASLSNIKIISQRSIASILTEVESPFTDITGLATLTFIPQVPYTLTFDLNGLTIGTGTYIPASSDSQKKAFLDITDINVGTYIQQALDVNFTPAGGLIVLGDDFNATTISQDINVFDGNLTSLRILVTIGETTLSDTNHAAVGTFTQTLALNGIDLNQLVIVEVTAVISGQSFLVRQTYGLRTSPGIEQLATDAKNQDIGFTGATIISIIVTAAFIGGAIRLTRTESQDNSNLSFLVIPILMFFAFINWVSWVPIIFGSAAAIILYFSKRASSGGFS